MNNTMRAQIDNILNEIESLKESIQEVMDLEEEYKESIPENMQGGERYARSEERVSELDSCICSLEEAAESLESAKE